jgi:hypothetical protein
VLDGLSDQQLFVRIDCSEKHRYNGRRFPPESEVPVAKKPARRREWSKEDVRELKSLARAKTPARVIGRKLGRTEGAVRQKAYAEGVSFNSRSRARSKS